MMLPEVTTEIGGPAALFSVCLFTGMGLPFPEEVPLLVAGWEMREGHLAVLPSFGAAFVALYLRDVAAFLLGRLIRSGSRIRWVQRFSQSPKGLRIQGVVDRFGDSVLYVARFAAGFRVPLVVAAGMSTASWRRMLLLEGPGLLLTIPTTLWLGWRYGDAAVGAFQVMLQHQKLVLGGVVIVAMIGVGIARWRTIRSTRS